MERFIARENIRRFKEQLRNCHDERQRASLKQILADEEQKLEDLEGSRLKSAKPSELTSQYERNPLMKLEADLNR